MITKFKLFESHQEIKSICDRYNIQNWELNSKTGRVDVIGDVNLSGKNLKELPLKFGMVSGDFYCNNNQLTSLEGGPNSVGGDFNCYNNQLTSLEGSPNSVGRNFYCNNNQLTSLEGGPNSVGGDFYCGNNQIVDFKVPEYSLNENGEFSCVGNPIWEIYNLFKTPKCIDLINEYEVIGDGVISRIRLEEVFLELGMEVPKNLRFKEWELV